MRPLSTVGYGPYCGEGWRLQQGSGAQQEADLNHRPRAFQRSYSRNQPYGFDTYVKRCSAPLRDDDEGASPAGPVKRPVKVEIFRPSPRADREGPPPSAPRHLTVPPAAVGRALAIPPERPGRLRPKGLSRRETHTQDTDHDRTRKLHPPQRGRHLSRWRRALASVLIETTFFHRCNLASVK